MKLPFIQPYRSSAPLSSSNFFTYDFKGIIKFLKGACNVPTTDITELLELLDGETLVFDVDYEVAVLELSLMVSLVSSFFVQLIAEQIVKGTRLDLW
ncbi:hypothetical protein L2E82_46556 [Cichorium intybus]|uniref:Uncharacterized protein n=1 Tax=Cichorium intybus TaxID=13427 RepID=A0ACB8YTN9_CICIN|nr:hypothetical protein L1887_26268 [Cichorium endivia]KAI3688753.1 hypothetical protein L2E82_46556 [Cichorium intybus]